MTSGSLAAFFAVLALGFVEGWRRFYPSKATWLRLRSRHGRRAIRAMRERMEAAAASKLPRQLASVLGALVVGWIASASLLDKRWYEVLMDVLPYVFIGIAMLRVPGALRAIAERMREYERDTGEDPDLEMGDGGPTAIAL